jgi:hypothetical protein
MQSLAMRRPRRGALMGNPPQKIWPRPYANFLGTTSEKEADAAWHVIEAEVAAATFTGVF